MHLGQDVADRATEAPVAGGRLLSLLKGLLIALGLIGFGLVYARFRYPNLFVDSGNYDFRFAEPAGWSRLPWQPLSMFRYKNDKYDVFLRGFQYQTISEVGPGDGLDGDGLAEYYTATTRSKQPGWTAERLADFTDGPVRFSLLRRSKQGKVVYTAFTTKGNSTFGITMYANGEEIPRLEELLADLRKLLTSVSLVPSQTFHRDMQ